MKQLSLTWTDGHEALRKFNFVFHIALKGVRGNQEIESIIVEQHAGLCGNNVQPHEIKTILEDKTLKVLIILDGHDEYKPGTNTNIDRMLTKQHLRNCWIVLTSRETKELATIREYLDAEAEIKGFDKRRVEEYITKYLGGKNQCEELLKMAEKSRIINRRWPLHDFGILCIPILLHMICVLFITKVSLPKTKTGIISAIVKRCPDWDEIRKTGQKKVKAAEDALVKLGEFVLGKLLQGDKSQVFQKVILILRMMIMIIEQRFTPAIEMCFANGQNSPTHARS